MAPPFKVRDIPLKSSPKCSTAIEIIIKNLINSMLIFFFINFPLNAPTSLW